MLSFRKHEIKPLHIHTPHIIQRQGAHILSVRTELQVRENLTLDRVYPVLPLHQREGYPEGCKQLRKLLLEKKTERMKVFYHILGQKEICRLLNMGNTCLILFIFSF